MLKHIPDTDRSVFTEELFTGAKGWKQSKFPSTDEWINKNMAYAYDEILFNRKDEQSADTRYTMDEPWKHG